MTENELHIKKILSNNVIRNYEVISDNVEVVEFGQKKGGSTYRIQILRYGCLFHTSGDFGYYIYSFPKANFEQFEKMDFTYFKEKDCNFMKNYDGVRHEYHFHCFKLISELLKSNTKIIFNNLDGSQIINQGVATIQNQVINF